MSAELSREGALTACLNWYRAPFVEAPWRYERIEGAGHWLQLERPEEVNALLLDFLPTP